MRWTTRRSTLHGGGQHGELYGELYGGGRHGDVLPSQCSPLSISSILNVLPSQCPPLSISSPHNVLPS